VDGVSAPGQISSALDLPPIKQLFWHVRAFDPTTVGPWSSTQAFQTPAPIILPPPPPPDVPAVGPAPGDAMSLGVAGVYNSPPDIASWAVTSRITRVDMSPSSGLNLEFTTKAAGLTHAPWLTAPVHCLGSCEHQR
jgi:hypothetical protein